MRYTRSPNGMNLLYTLMLRFSKVSFIPSAFTNVVNCKELLRMKKLQISILNFKEVWKQLSQSNLYSTSTFLLPKNRPRDVVHRRLFLHFLTDKRGDRFHPFCLTKNILAC